VRTLAIESATEACSAALFEDGALLAGAYEVLGRGHAERLVPMISELPGRGKADRVVLSLGPGSFTGVRIGLAAARALGLAWQAEVLGYPTLAMVAAMARETHPVPVTVCMSGGHGEWFIENFGVDGLSGQAHASLDPAQAIAAARHDLVAGSRAEALVALRGSGEALHLLPDARSFPLLPESLITANLAPIYGRPPDARLPA
jgi:tRNA threonylcarbamoyl adenosine modification protein YeaZ